MSVSEGRQLDATHVILPDGQAIRAKIFYTQFNAGAPDNLAGTSVLRLSKLSEGDRPKVQVALRALGFQSEVSLTKEVVISVNGGMADLEKIVAPLNNMLRKPEPALMDADIAKLDWDYTLPRSTGGEMELSLNLNSLPPEHQRQFREKFKLDTGVGQMTLYRQGDGTIRAQGADIREFVNQQLLPVLVIKALPFAKTAGGSFRWEMQDGDTVPSPQLLTLAATLSGVSAQTNVSGDINVLTVEPVRGLSTAGLHYFLDMDSSSPAADAAGVGKFVSAGGRLGRD